jgi:hypothetical protein
VSEVSRDCLVLGAPGPINALIFDAISVLLKQASGASLVRIGHGDDIGERGDARCIYITECPSNAAIAAISDGRLTAVVLIDDAAQAVQFVMQTSKSSFIEAIRAQTASVTAHLAAGHAEGTISLSCPNALPVRDMLQQLATSLRIPLDRDALPSMCQELAGSAAPDASLDDILQMRASTDGTMTNAISTATQELVKRTVADVIEPLQRMARGQFGQPIVWPTHAFYLGDTPGHHPQSPAPVTGPSRVLYYGPYFHLPPGDYDVEIAVTFGGSIEDISFTIELLGGGSLGRARIEPRASGTYRGRFLVSHWNAAEPIEIHLRNEQGSITGEITLLGLQFWPAPEM